jgi:hypothetical protein
MLRCALHDVSSLTTDHWQLIINRSLRRATWRSTPQLGFEARFEAVQQLAATAEQAQLASQS